MSRLNRHSPLAALLLIACAATHAEAQTSPVEKAAAVTPRRPYFALSLASADALEQFLKDAQLQPLHLKEGLESKSKFLSGVVATDKPIGLMLFSLRSPEAREAEEPPSGAIVVPAIPGKLSAETLEGAAGGFAAGTKDTILLNVDTAVRRTASDVVFGRLPPDSLSVVPDAPFAADYRLPGTLAFLRFNMAAFRDSAPVAYAQLRDTMHAEANNPGEQLFSARFKAGVESLEEITASLSADEKAVHVHTRFSPWTVEAVRPAPRPVFPPGTIGEIHFVRPDAWAQWPESVVASIPDAAFAPLTGDDLAAARSAVRRALALTGGGRAVSVGLAGHEDAWVTYVVNQCDGPIDAIAAAKKLVGDIEGLEPRFPASTQPAATQAAPVFTTYDDGGYHVTRIDGSPAIRDSSCFDLIQVGNTIYLTNSKIRGKYVAALAAGGMKGETTTVLQGSMQLSKVAEAWIVGLNEPFGLKDEIGRVTFTVGPGEGRALALDIEFPWPVARPIVRAVANDLATRYAPPAQPRPAPR